MDPTITSLGIPDGIAGWEMLQGKTPASFPALTNDPVIKQQIAYFEANAPKATTAQALMSNPQLQDFALTAFGLTSESGMTGFMTKVLDSNPTASVSFATALSNPAFAQMAKAFNYGATATAATPATPSSAQVDVSGLYQQSTFGKFSGTFGGVSVSNVDLTGATTWQGLANTLQAAFQKADGNKSNITVTLNGSNLVFHDAAGRGTATNFSWTANASNTQPNPTASAPINLVAGETSAQASGQGVPATASGAEVAMSGLTAGVTIGSFSGTFGGVTLSNVDLSRATSETQVAATLQAAFQSADGNNKNITVKANGLNLEFSDAAGRGTASNFTWMSNPDNTGGDPTVAEADNLVAGTTAIPAAGAAAVASKSQVSLSGLMTGSTLGTFSGTFGGVSVSNVNLSGDTSQTQVAQALQAALRQADGNSTNISVAVSGLNLVFTDAAGRGAASGFTWGANAGNTGADPVAGAATTIAAGSMATPAAGSPATASTAQVQVGGLAAGNNFGSFTGLFGGVVVANVDLTGDTTASSMASTLQSAFQTADSNSKNITVTANGDTLVFKDAAGRGTAVGFSWSDNPANAQGEPTVSAPTNKVPGNQAVPASAASTQPAVTSPTFIQTVVQKYLQAQMNNVVGNTSNSLEEALYAQQNLSSVTSWYQVIASPPLAAVVEGALGLPSSFGALDVDKQVAMLSQRMNIKDFQNPTKLKSMLTTFVALSSLTTTSTSAASGALTLLNSASSFASDNYSSASMSALLTST